MLSGDIMAFNDEMERYMRDRKRRSMTYTGDGASQPGWWDRVFFPKKEDAPRDHLTPDEMAKVTAMEQDIKKGEERLEDADDTTHETLADKQEARVGLYERFLRMFQTERKMEDDYEHIDGEQLHGTTVIKNDLTKHLAGDYSVPDRRMADEGGLFAGLQSSGKETFNKDFVNDPTWARKTNRTSE